MVVRFIYDDDDFTGASLPATVTDADTFTSFATVRANPAAIPEPSSLALLALGAAAVMGRRKRKAICLLIRIIPYRERLLSLA